MTHKAPLKLAVLPGDGIGVEVTQAAIPVFECLGIPVQLTFGDIGWSFWKNEANAIPEGTWKLIAESDATLVGAITSKPEREARKELSEAFKDTPVQYVSPIIQLRQKLDLFANVRPCFSIQESDNPFNFCIIRENTEGLYAGFDYHPIPESIKQLVMNNPRWREIPAGEISCTLRLQSQAAWQRIFEYSFQYAQTQGMKRVTFADKPNVLRQSGAFARDIFESVSAQYPDIVADVLNVDAVALWLVRRPEEFGVIVAENMFADILSDVGAAVMGGLGFAPSANVGSNGCYFEPVHGSAPRIKAHSANPSAMFLTIGLLLNHFGYPQQAQQIIQALRHVAAKKRCVTYDLGGRASTAEMANEIMNQCQPAGPAKKSRQIMNHINKLQEFTTAELSDALDACGIEGALLNIKPLSPGLKLIGPAYTIQFALNTQKQEGFNNAANYIDQIPAHSVVVIDNEGRNECTAWGEILTRVALQKGLAGTVVHGAVRDVALIRDLQYPVYSSGVSMRSGKNRIHKISEQTPLVIGSVSINPGDLIVADDNGVLVIPRLLVEDIIQKAERVKLTEQNIVAAVKAGSTLEQARMDYGYDRPWENRRVDKGTK